MNIDLRFARNLGAITPAQQRRLGSTRIVVAGLGGVGGLCAELLVRAGIGRLMVIDFDQYEPSNLNRQIHAERKMIGRKKVDVFAEKMRDINPKLRLEKIGRKIEYSSLSFFERKVAAFHPAIVIDTMDTAPARVMLARLCRKQSISYIYAAAMGSRGIVSMLEGRKKGKTSDLECILHLPSFGRLDSEIESSLIHYPQCRSAWGPATNLMGVLAANSALNYLLKKPFPRAPDFWMMDVFGQKIVRTERLA